MLANNSFPKGDYYDLAVTWSALLFEYTASRTYNLLDFVQVFAEIKNGNY